MDAYEQALWKRINPPTDVDIPERYESLTPLQKEALQNWIAEHLELDASINNRSSSYGMKHVFEAAPNGFYITNGTFKGAMLAAGYRTGDPTEKNWSFNVSRKSLTRLWELPHKL